MFLRLGARDSSPPAPNLAKIRELQLDVEEGELARAKAAELLDDRERPEAELEQLRTVLLDSGRLVADGDHLRFTEDYVFSSPSTAAMVMLGRTANGRIEWKTAGGVTLKMLQVGDAVDSAPAC